MAQNSFHILRPLILAVLVMSVSEPLFADPILSSWFTEASTKYARIYTSTANRAAGISTTTWSNQTLPTYAGVHEINYSSNWVYLKNTGLAPYVMGPWNNPNLPKNQGTSTGVYRFPRNPTVNTNLAPTGRTLTGMGAIGFLVDGVAIYNTSDGFSYSVSNNKDASPIAGIGPGDGIWNRDALPNESISFDYTLNHPQPSGQYHAHVNPIGIRYLLGDNVNYDATNKSYAENLSSTRWNHSPILGWMNDGLPLYGPYGYANPTNATSGVRRMISGYVLRDGSYGTTNLSTAGRKTLPLWAQQAQNRSTLTSGQWGPNVSTTYELGHYAEDYDYLGDLGYVQGVAFDLNKYNARYCVTPEYPNGTWAYFVTIKADGSPMYPYNVGRWYMATPSGGSSTLSTMNADTPLAQYYKGATNTVETWRTNNPLAVSTNKVTLVWNAVEGGTYRIYATNDLSSTNTNWPTLASSIVATNNSMSYDEAGSLSSVTRRFYKFVRTGMATYDSVGY